MSKEIKAIANKAETFDKLELRLGRVTKVEDAPDSVAKKSYVITADFGKFGIKTTVGRFTCHDKDDLLDQIIVGVLNFGIREMGGIQSEFLLLGAQYPKADSGEATFLTPAINVKIGGKIF